MLAAECYHSQCKSFSLRRRIPETYVAEAKWRERMCDGGDETRKRLDEGQNSVTKS